jgi:chaperone BCS1
MHQLVALAVLHPAMTAVIMATLVGLAGAALNQLPKMVWRLLWSFWSVRLEVVGQDRVYAQMARWVGTKVEKHKTRTLRVNESDDGYRVSPGYGTHWVQHCGKKLMVRREFDENLSDTWGNTPKERIVITAFGRGPEPRQLLSDLVIGLQENKEKGVGVRVWHAGQWHHLPPRACRPMESVVIDPELRREIVAKTEWFLGAQQWFANIGVPYRHGFLIKGPPGTGKTSIVVALASRYKRPLCIINLSAVNSDNDLLNAFTMAGNDAFILIEDVDAARSAATREETEHQSHPDIPTDPGQPPSQKSEEKQFVTLSGLLNALDGVAASEGRLLFLTSNHPEKLDPALLRKGRVDKEFFLGNMTPALVAEMAARFFPEEPEFIKTARAQAELQDPLPAAEWQGRFMDRAQQLME